MNLFDLGIQLLLLIPSMGFLLSLLIPGRNEKLLSGMAFGTTVSNLILFVIFSVVWIFKGTPTVNIEEISLYKNNDYEFLIDFLFDEITAVYLLVGTLITFLITAYSKLYLHREEGYKRFFNTIHFFYLGYMITVLAGNFETLFIGWEIIGLSSFLLISFYRDRYLPVRNSIKVFSVYRISDIGILLAMWASHHLWHENIAFVKLSDYGFVDEHLTGHSGIGIFISMMILLAAAAKSAQLPFSSWLPRAMEGPTPSSAIFYGSLSVHFGVFLLLRTFPFWEHQWGVRILIGLLGLATALVAGSISRVQSTIKTQIAYDSIAQIGIIFIEVALGLEKLALFHFAGNAFLRTYQLLISPSVVTYLIREQFYNFRPETGTRKALLRKFDIAFYFLSIKEWNLDTTVNKFVFKPLKRAGKQLKFINYKVLLFVMIPLYLLGASWYFISDEIPDLLHLYFPYLFSFIGMLLILKSFSERKSPSLAWLLILFNHYWIALAVSFNEYYSLDQSLMYLSGISVAGFVGFICLRRLEKLEPKFVDLSQNYGHVFEYPRLSLVFLLSCMGLMGFPITLSFIGEDLLFSHIHEDQFFLALFASVGFVLGGISVVRIYARLFLGPHIKNYHETAIKSG